MSIKIKNASMLFAAAFIWGTAFVFQSKANDYMQPFTFSAARCILGAIVLLPLILLKYFKPKNKAKKYFSLKTSVIGGVCCGIALTAASVLQQYGVKYTSVGKAGFITTLYIIFTPILGILIKKKCPWTVWISAIVAAIGLYLLCMTESFSLSYGDILVLICAILFSVHILVIDYFSDKADGLIVACVQLFVCFIISSILALIFDKPTFTQIQNGILPILYAGIMSSGVAYTLQVLGQKNFNPTAAAIILSLESVVSAIAGYFAYIFGFLINDQSLTYIQIIGCIIVFMAVIFAQLPITKAQRKN